MAAFDTDHDLLVELKTMTKMILDRQEHLATDVSSIASRVSALEVKDRGDSEKIGSVIEMVKTSNNNSARVAEAHARIDNVTKDVDELKDTFKAEMGAFRSRSNAVDAINAVGVIIAGTLGTIFGSR
jgi:TolA-binding protein